MVGGGWWEFIRTRRPSTFVTVVDTGVEGFRALTGLLEGSGRTVAIAGPPASGKSAVLAELRAQLNGLGCQVIEVAGSFRERSATNALAQRIVDSYGRGASAGESGSTGIPDEPSAMAWAYAAPPVAPTSSSSRVRSRAGLRPDAVVRPEDFWTRWVRDLRSGAPTPLAICVDDAQLADSESRAFLGDLSRRARFRPLLVALALDTSVPAAGLWDEYLAGRGDVDWIRRPYPKPDPRDVQRAHDALERLPPVAQRLVRLTFLLGDSVALPTLARVVRMGREQLLQAAKAPIEAGLLRIRDDRVAVASDALRPVLEELLPGNAVSEMHAAIADALVALHPEPSPDQEAEIARHLFARARDGEALRALCSAAARLEREARIEEASALIGAAIRCSLELTEPDRIGVEAGLRVERARLLVYSGRVEDAEREVREGLGLALLAQLPNERLEELLESLLPALRLVGPRTALVSELSELCDRFHDREAPGAEALALGALVDYELQRGRLAVAREESVRCSRLVRTLPKGPAQAVGLLSVAAPILDGSEEERRIAAKCVRSARDILETYRRPELQLYTDEVYARQLLGRGETRSAIALHDQAVHVAERARNLPYEFIHNVALAALLSDGRGDPRLQPALKRSLELSDRFALSGPASRALELFLLQGRWQARAEHREEAREWWSSVADRLSPLVPNAYRAEAWMRLADLEVREGRMAEARSHLERLERPELRNGLRGDWAGQLADLRSRVDRAVA
ncbi:MAG TPA: ATP-binding protein [Thermoplasmata archaeon]|nr:ATP-binding protein [Thermoplasmata archaeon]